MRTGTQSKQDSRPFNWSDSLAVLGLGSASVGAVYLLLSGGSTTGGPDFALLFNWAAHAFLFAIPLVYHLVLRRRFPIGRPARRNLRTWIVPWSVLLAISLSSDVSTSLGWASEGYGSLLIVNANLSNGIFIGLSEEFFFRGAIQTGLNNSTGWAFKIGSGRLKVGTVIASLIYMLFHLGNVYSLPFTLLFGLVVGHYYDKTGRIWGGVIIHNAIDLLTIFVPMLI